MDQTNCLRPGAPFQNKVYRQFQHGWIIISVIYKVWDEVTYPYNDAADIYWACDYIPMLRLIHVSKIGAWTKAICIW